MTPSSVTTLLGNLIEKNANRFPDKAAFWFKNHAGWKSSTWKEVSKEVHFWKTYLLNKSIKKGDIIVISHQSSPEWEYLHWAALAIGAIVIGLDPADSKTNIQSKFENISIHGVFLTSVDMLRNTDTYFIDKLKFILLFNSPPDSAINFPCDFWQNISKEHFLSISSQNSPLLEDDFAMVASSSGTTGAPKLSFFTHQQVDTACQSIANQIGIINSQSHLVCWLPLGNAFQQMVNICGVYYGSEIYFVESPKNILKDLQKIKPTVFASIPYFYEKIQKSILEKFLNSIPFGKTILKWFEISDEKLHFPQKYFAFLIRKMIYIQLRKIFGGHIPFLISGSSRLQPSTLKWFNDLGIEIYEAYGISENIIPLAMNTRLNKRNGTVGKPLPENRIQINDGEILVKSLGVASLTLPTSQNRIVLDGYFKTGDRGYFDPDGMLVLQGRINDDFKTSTGRNISPLPIESELFSLPFIEHVTIIGSQRPFLIAILATPPGSELARKLINNFASESTLLLDHIRKITQKFPEYAQPKGALVVERVYSFETGELTANRKVKRQFISSFYEKQINMLYTKISSSSHEPGVLLA